jgi:hypothetical protein
VQLHPSRRVAQSVAAVTVTVLTVVRHMHQCDFVIAEAWTLLKCSLCPLSCGLDDSESA